MLSGSVPVGEWKRKDWTGRDLLVLRLIPRGVLKLGRPWRVVPNWSKRSGPYTLALTSQWIRLLPGRDHHIEQDGFLQLRGTSAASCQSSTVSDPGEMCALVLRKGDVDSIPQSPPYSASKKSKWDSRFPARTLVHNQVSFLSVFESVPYFFSLSSITQYVID